MKTITIRNDYHNTTARVRCHEGERETMLRRATVLRIRRALCGFGCCTCGGVLGQRGRQDVTIDEMHGGEVMIRRKGDHQL